MVISKTYLRLSLRISGIQRRWKRLVLTERSEGNRGKSEERSFDEVQACSEGRERVLTGGQDEVREKRRVGQSVKTPPFHGGMRGSTPLRGTNRHKALV